MGINQRGITPLILIFLGIMVIALIVAVAAYLNVNKKQPSSQQTNNTVNVQNKTQVSQKNKVPNVEKYTYIKQGDVYVFDLNSKQEKKLTDYGYNSAPILSPDNTKIAYLSIPKAVVSSGQVSKGTTVPYSLGDYYGMKNIWVISSDGADPVQVTNSLKKRDKISWSSDSSKFTFEEEEGIKEYILQDKQTRDFNNAGKDMVYSPLIDDSAYTINDGKTLQVHHGKGTSAFSHKEKISNINWSADGQNIFFTSTDESEQSGHSSTLRLKYSIWTYPLSDGRAFALTSKEDKIQYPFISPDNSYIVASKGSGYADAGNIDLSLVVLKLNSDFSVDKQIKLQDFKGPDYFEKEKQFIFPAGAAIWLNNVEFLIRLAELMEPQPNPGGLYKLNISSLKAERLLVLP